jgi:DCN1-like protein 1/2
MDPVILVISKYFKAEAMGVYSRREFLEGMQALNVSSVQDLKTRLPVLRGELADRRRFKETYRFTFNFAREPGRRNLSHEAAVEMWKLLLPDKYPQTALLLEFMAQREKQHDVSGDTWNMIVDFFDLVQEQGLVKYSDDGAWPTFIDELAEFMRTRG